jgi:hypothetical protein
MAGHPREIVEPTVGERVIAVGVKPGRDQHQLETKDTRRGQHWRGL